MPSPIVSRLIAAPTLVASGMLALPVAATFLDHPEGRENWILPAQFGANALIGGAVGAGLPHIAGGSATRGRGALVGAAAGVVAAGVADAAWFFLLAG